VRLAMMGGERGGGSKRCPVVLAEGGRGTLKRRRATLELVLVKEGSGEGYGIFEDGRRGVI